MKKNIAILLILVLLSTLPICVSAEEMAAQPTPDTDDAAPIMSLIQPREPAFTISQLSSNSRIIVTECRVNQGVTQLRITNATWYPSMSIEIGFEHQTTGARYKVDFTQEAYNGSINNFIITTPNVPSGSYYVYVKNNGAMAIGSGTFYYELTG